MEEYNYRTWACYGCKGNCKCAECADIRQQGRTEKIKKYARSKESKKSVSLKTSSSRQHKLQDAGYSPPTTKVMVVENQQISVKKEDIAMPDPEDGKGIFWVGDWNCCVDDITLDKKNIDDSKIISEINIDSGNKIFLGIELIWNSLYYVVWFWNSGSVERRYSKEIW